MKLRFFLENEIWYVIEILFFLCNGKVEKEKKRVGKGNHNHGEIWKPDKICYMMEHVKDHVYGKDEAHLIDWSEFLKKRMKKSCTFLAHNLPHCGDSSVVIKLHDESFVQSQRSTRGEREYCQDTAWHVHVIFKVIKQILWKWPIRNKPVSSQSEQRSHV